MHDMKNNTENGPTDFAPGHPLKTLTEGQFADLGGQHVVFVRKISAGKLADIVPEAGSMPEDALYHLVMAANGSPMMVSDSESSVNDWIDDNNVEVAQVH